jgi:hypothetical protein
MRFLELQFRAPQLSQLLVAAFKSRPITVTTPIALDGDRSLVIDRVRATDVLIERGASTVIDYWADDGYDQKHAEPVDAFEVQAMLTLEVYARLATGLGTVNPRLQDLKIGFANASPLECEMWVQITADVNTGSNKPTVGFVPSGLTVPDLSPMIAGSSWDVQALTASIEQRVLALAPVKKVPIPWQPPSQVSIQPIAAGVATTATADVVAFRFETMPLVSSAPAEWRRFHQGAFLPALAAHGSTQRDWALLLDGATATEMIGDGVASGLHKESSVYVTVGPDVELQNAEPGRVTVDVWADVQNPTIHPTVHAHSDITLSATTDGMIQERSVSGVDVPGGPLTSIVLDLFTPLLYWVVTSQLTDAIAPSPSNAFVSGVLAAIAFDQPVPFPTSSPGGGWDCTSPEVGIQVCTAEGSRRFAVGQTTATLWLDSVITRTDALMQVGHLILASLPPEPLLTGVGQSGPTWTAPDVPCAEAAGVGSVASKLVEHPFDYLTASATLFVSGNSTHVTLEAATLVSPDPAGAVAAIDISDDRGQAVIRFAIGDVYQSDPYPFWILAFTTGGAALVRFDVVTVLDDQLTKQLAISMLGKAAGCFSEVNPFFRHFHRLNPLWAVDPGIESREYVRLAWSIFREHLEGMSELPSSFRQ